MLSKLLKVLQISGIQLLCVNLLCGIDGIQYLDDGHWQLLRNKLCGKLSRLDRRLWSGNGSNICGNKIVTSWRGACSNRGATNKSSNVSKNKVETEECSRHHKRTKHFNDQKKVQCIALQLSPETK